MSSLENIPIDRIGSKASILANPGQSLVSFQNVCYTVKVPDTSSPTSLLSRFSKTKMMNKQILKNVNGLFRPNRMTAVMGASGAGKTSLLQIISGEANSGQVSGTLAINGVPVQPSQLKKISGFVFQDDIILQTMTVAEALGMAAKLRLPESYTQEQRQQAVEETITMLKLEKARDTIVGDSEERGLSGGERKRLACGMSLISNPSCLFLDEPTSGLDTFTASKVVSILRDVARTGRTVIATIHQPSAETFFMFDDLLLLAEGRVVYHGPVNQMVSYFEKTFGYQIPSYENPADWVFANILNVFRDDKAEGGASERIGKLLNTWPNTLECRAIETQLSLVNSSKHVDLEGIPTNVTRGFWTQYSFLVIRNLKAAWRDKLVLRAKFGQAVGFAIFLGLLYFNIPGTPETMTQNLTGVSFFIATSNVMQSSMSVLSVFAEEKAVFRREFASGYYGLGSFFCAKLSVELPYSILFSIIQATIIYWMANLSPSFVNYVLTMCFAALSTACGLTLGMMLASMFDSLQVALNLVPMITLPFMLTAGLFVNVSSLGWWCRWISYISPVRYAAEGIIRVLLPSQVAMNLYGDGLTVLTCALILLAEALVLTCLAYLGLYRVTVLSRKRVKWNPTKTVVASDVMV